MKRIKLMIAITILGYTLFATQLWNGAISGMTIQEVKNKFTNVSPGNSDFNISRGNLINGANLFNMNIGGKKYDVKFYFNDGKLVTVRLELKINDVTATKDVDDIRLQLTQKYGTVTDKTTDNSANMSSSNYFWIKDGVKVELAHHQAYGMHFVWIDYSEIGNTALL